MRFAVKTLLILFSLSLSVYAQFTAAAYSQSPSDAQEIRRSMLEVEKAFVSRDPEPFARVYLDGYVNVREKPIFNYRDQLEAMVKWDAEAIRAGKKRDYETLSYNSELPKIDLYGDVAIVNVLKKDHWRYRDDRCLTQYQTTELWIKSAGVWKVAVGHMSTMQCEQPPWQLQHPAVDAIRAQLRPTKFISVPVETELRELLSKLNDAGLRSDNNLDAFTTEYVCTTTNGVISSDRSTLLNALKIPTGRNRERYRDDEIFLSFGNAAIYLFRIRAFPKAGETAPPRPIVFSVMFVRSGANWKIAASHASELSD